MIAKCCVCFKTLSLRLMGQSLPKWHSHLSSFCSRRGQKQPWCSMFLDNIDLITELTLPREIEHQVRSTNIATEIVSIINSHYLDENNLFKFCIELFGSYLKLKYSETINPSKHTLLRIAIQYQDFTQLLIDLFVLYYNLEDREIIGEQTFYKSTLPSLANQLAFQNQNINSTVHQIAKLSLKPQTNKIQFQMQRLSHQRIDYYLAKQQLWLNQGTLELYKIDNGRIEEQVYSGVSQILKEIVRVNSPAQKLKLIEGIPKQIESSVQQFHKKNNIFSEKIEVMPQDLTSIITFLLVEMNQPLFYAHLQVAILFNKSTSMKVSHTLEALENAFESLQNGLVGKKEQLQVLEMEEKPRKESDSLTFFDEVTSNLDL